MSRPHLLHVSIILCALTACVEPTTASRMTRVAGRPLQTIATCSEPTFAGARFFHTGGGLPVRLAVTDFDRDGKADVVVAIHNAGTLAVSLGHGDGTFAAARLFAAGFSTPTAVASADFNNDGFPDIATGDVFRPQASILLGDGTGGFGAPRVMPADAGVYGIAAADFNGDGNIDLLTTSYDPSLPPSRVILRPGDGTGSFGPPLYTATAGQAVNATTADVNNDGHLDLVVGGVAPGPSTVLTNDGNGGFVVASTLPSGPAAVGDINNDGNTDVIIGHDGIQAFLGNGAGSFIPGPSITSEEAKGLYFTAVDLNGDGHLDIAGNNGFPGMMLVYPGTADGNFAGPAYWDAGIGTVAVAADINDDGRADLLNPNYFDQSFSLLLNTGPTLRTGTLVVFDQTKAYRAGSTIPVRMQLLDCDGANVSSPQTQVTALDVRLTGGTTAAPVMDAGQANPDGGFRYDAGVGGGGGYIYNLSTKELSAGTYTIRFRTSISSAIHGVTFELK